MKVLSISTMFPNRVQPNFGAFVQHRLLQLAKFCQLKVISAIPYFPAAGILERYAYRSRVEDKRTVDGIEVFYPKFLSIPAILKPLDGLFLAASLYCCCRRLQQQGFDPDIIDAHLAYPDGFAAVILGKLLQKPVTITLRGHDIFELPLYLVRGKQVKWALREADLVFSVAQALKDGAVALGISEEKIKFSPNGVDPETFYPIPQKTARTELDLPRERKIILSVGHLVVRKGFQFIIEAVAGLRREGYRNLMLVIVGAPGLEGNYQTELERKVRRLGLEEDVCFAGAYPNHQLYKWYSAADIFCLASLREGWPNVVLEAMACGRPVIGSRVWGTPEIISSPDYGILVEPGNLNELAGAIKKALGKSWDQNKLLSYARQRTWERVAGGVFSEMYQLHKKNRYV